MKSSRQEADWGAFTALEDAPSTSIIWSSQGAAGSGKTHFALTAPAPIAYFLFDPGGLKGLKGHDEFKTKDIKVIDLSRMLNFGRIDRMERVQRGVEAIGMFDEAWPIAMRNARTVVIDKEDAYWEALRYAHNEVDSPDPKSFGELNLQYQGLVAEAEEHGVNLGLLRGLKEEWGITGRDKNGKPKQGFTGKVVPRGQKQVVEWAQVNLNHRWDDASKEFKVKILGKCRLGNAVDLLGQEYGMLDFQTLAALLYPDSDADDWS